MKPNEETQPIRIPTWKRWLEFRHRFLPMIVFVVMAGLTINLWDTHLSSPSLVGQVQIMRLDIRTTSTGTITNLPVQLFQTIRKGDVIAKLQPGDPLTSLGNKDDLLLAKKELLQLMDLTSAANAFDIQRNVLDKERLRTEWMQQRVNLASAEIRQQELENEWNRSKNLHEADLLSDSDYDRAEKAYSAVKAEVKERKTFIEDLDRTIKSIESLIEQSREIEQAKMEIDRTTLQRSIAKLEQEWVILAPADGMITAIQKRDGEMVRSSESIVTLTHSHSDKVIAYLPQGTETPLKIGQQVEVSSRSHTVRTCIGTILRIGQSFEAMPDALSQLQLYKAGGFGIPLIIALPPDFQCVPGEMVDINLNPPHRSKANDLAGR